MKHVSIWAATLILQAGCGEQAQAPAALPVIATGAQTAAGTNGAPQGPSSATAAPRPIAMTAGTGGMTANAGSGQSSGAAGMSSLGSAGISGAAGAVAQAGGGGAAGAAGGAAESPAAGLDKLLLEAPCPMPTMGGNCENDDAAARKKSQTIRFGGDPATKYLVGLKVCGVIEGRRYMGCEMNAAGEPSLVCINGTPLTNNATYPALSLVVSEPMRTYYLNNGWIADDIIKLDFSARFEIQGGSSVTLATDGGSNGDTYTARRNRHDYTCADVPGIMQPFAGQFVYVTVESVEPAM